MLLHPCLVVSPVLNKDKHNNHKYGHTSASSGSGTAQKLNWTHVLLPVSVQCLSTYYRHYRDLQTNIALCEARCGNCELDLALMISAAGGSVLLFPFK